MTTTPAASVDTTTPSTAVADSITYLALGDSYTIGESVISSLNFPNQLVNKLRTSGYPKAAAPVIIARTGWRTDDLMNAIKDAQLTQKFTYVTLLIGVNNQFQGRSLNTYRTEFIELLYTAISFANGNAKHVFVLSIPDYGVTPFAADRNPALIAQQIDQFNAVNQEESAKAGVGYVNITPISRMAATDLTLVAPDGLHPSATMYSLWVKQLVDPVIQSLK